MNIQCRDADELNDEFSDRRIAFKAGHKEARHAAAELALGANTLADALRQIAKQDPVELALDPQWAQRVARITLTAADGFRSAAAELAKLKGQRAVLCSLLGECLPVIDALMQVPGDDDSDARLNGLAGRITGALNALAEEQVMWGES